MFEGMPGVGHLDGIKFYIYYFDHNPPHFHAREAGDEVQITIRECSVMEGDIPSLSDAIAWGRSNRLHLISEWNRINPDNPY